MAAREAQSWLDLKYETMFPPYYEGRRWVFPISPEVIGGLQSQFADPDSYPVEGRRRHLHDGVLQHQAFGVGQFYLMTIKDKAGQPFDGSHSYRLAVPANVPVNRYWSATVYDRATHALIRDMPRAGRSSQSPGLQTKVDGSVDICARPKPPAGQESNGCRPVPAEKSRSCSASTVPRSRCSTRHGCCRTSSGSPLSEQGAKP